MVRKMGFSDALGLVNLDDDGMRWMSKAKKSLVESEIQRSVPVSLLARSFQMSDPLMSLLFRHMQTHLRGLLPRPDYP